MMGFLKEVGNVQKREGWRSFSLVSFPKKLEGSRLPPPVWRPSNAMDDGFGGCRGACANK